MHRLPIAILSLILLASRPAWADSVLGLGPLGMSGKSVGGAYSVGSTRLMDFVSHRDPLTQEVTYNWQPVGGARNVGLTAKIWGTVTATYQLPTGEKWFYVDDGSGVDADLGDIGVLVYSDADVKDGQIVSVVGTVDVEQSFDSWGRLVRTIEPASAADVTVLREAPPGPQYPFSDEFDGPDLDLRWILSGHFEDMSTSAPPGFLTIAPSRWSYHTGAVQVVIGDWDAEFKMKIECTPGVDGTAFGGLSDTIYYVASQAIAGVEVACNGSTMTGTVYTLGHAVSAGQADTLWFRCRRRGTSVYASYSTDGLTFSPEVAKTYQYICGLHLCARKSADALPFAVHFDYIRFSIPQ